MICINYFNTSTVGAGEEYFMLLMAQDPFNPSWIDITIFLWGTGYMCFTENRLTFSFYHNIDFFIIISVL